MLVYIYTFLQNPIGKFGIMTLFLLNKGLTMPQIVFISSVGSITTSLLSVPCGILIDKIGAKQSLILLSISELLYSLILQCSHSNSMFIVSGVVYGVGCSLLTSAYTYKMDYYGLEDIERYNKHITIQSAIQTLTSLLLVPLYGYLFQYCKAKVCIPLITLSFLKIVVALFLPNVNHVIKTETKESKLKPTLPTLNPSNLTTNLVANVILLGALSIGINRLVITYYPKMLLDCGVNSLTQSLYGTGITILLLTIPIVYKFIYSRLRTYEFAIIASLSTLSTFLVSQGKVSIILLGVACVYFSGGLIEIPLNRLIGQKCPEHRNFAISIKNLLKNLIHTLLCSYIAFRHLDCKHSLYFLSALSICCLLPITLHTLRLLKSDKTVLQIA